jgi:hypothetical protein
VGMQNRGAPASLDHQAHDRWSDQMTCSSMFHVSPDIPLTISRHSFLSRR